MQCSILDQVSYGQVRVTANRLTITPKGNDGQPQRDGALPCGPVVLNHLCAALGARLPQPLHVAADAAGRLRDLRGRAGRSLRAQRHLLGREPGLPKSPLREWQIWNEPHLPAYWDAPERGGGCSPARCRHEPFPLRAGRGNQRFGESADVVRVGQQRGAVACLRQGGALAHQGLRADDLAPRHAR
jgi:hypothetical protein